MIRVRNLADIAVPLTIAGIQAVANDQAVIIAPFAGVIDAIYAKLGTAGSGGSTQVTDVKKNGTSIWASGGLSFASGAQACTYGTLTTNPTTVAKGDVIRLDTTAINGVAGKDLTVWIVFTRQRTDYSQGSMETDTLSSQSDTL